MDVVLIGAGNTATILGRLIQASSHRVVQVCARNAESGSLLAATLNCGYTRQTTDIKATADLYIVAIADNAIGAVAKSLPLRQRLVVHTAGSVAMDILQAASKNYGVLYPLQSLRKEMQELPVIPLLVDGNTGDDRTLLFDFASDLSPIVHYTDDEARRNYHLAATIANNFSNHLYTLAQEYCQSTGTDFSVLLPLIQQLPQLLSAHPPRELQTGPAMRNDTITIAKHIDMLQSMPTLQQLYVMFTKSIKDHHSG